MERVPCVVIGAGAVGLAIGRAISRAGIDTMVLESQSTFGAGNSSRNSEVLHAGLYYTPGSMKAKMCNNGKNQMLSYLKDRRIPYSQCGKIVIASSDDEIPTLQKIYKNGAQNGLNDLKMLTAQDVHALEPLVACVAGMLSPFTGIFDSHNLMLSYIVEIEEAGSGVVYNCEVQSVKKESGGNTTSGFEVVTSQGTIQCDYLVNSAGLFAPFVAACMDFYPPRCIPSAYYAKGNYFKTQGVAAKDVPFSRLIYPIPQAGGLGVHATLDLEGNVKFGPNVEWLPFPHHQKKKKNMGTAAASVGEDRYLFARGSRPPTDFTVSLDTSTFTSIQQQEQQAGLGSATASEPTAEVFFREISRYWPGVRREMLVPDYAGIRPKLCGPTTSSTSSTSTNNSNTAADGGEGSCISSGGEYTMPASTDFAVLGSAAHGVQGLVCLFGIESPGLTASLAIADHVRDLLLLPWDHQ